MILQDTIYAVSTAPGKSAISVVRVSGKKAYESVKKISKSMPKKPNHSKLNKIIEKNGDTIDQTITTFYKSPKSYTGEDMVEISFHGGSAVLSKFIGMFEKNKDVRQAKPGEFTRRAFENNKLDLTQVEAVADLVNAETENQRKEAFNQLEGSSSLGLKKIHEKTKNLLAEAEAIIDFSDEDLPKNVYNQILEQIENIITEIDSAVSKNIRSRKIHNGYIVGIIGKTNTGKSSFINKISNQDVSIVTSQPGTTRDVLESYIDIQGLPVRFYDTAGIRRSKSTIENIGISKSKKLAENSDLNLIFIEKKSDLLRFKSYKNKIFVQSKHDIRRTLNKNKDIISISSKTGFGIKNLLKIISKKLIKMSFKEFGHISRERHMRFLSDSKKHLLRAKENKNYDKFCEDIRLALNEISKIYGKTDVEDILEIIFNDFCIGK
ncbi:MAG: tRNA modification GTPase MnmE [Alphaproteobacteria bacterium MarineAlpha5_Bin8]|nr:MAG: tRNA modification GTPase MnmE [Alphaproteobacteria bacterium MarineAlpha5_Bin7]PPR48362.1 MAG: tRNA modification GTPase MnmE [Alphaproteobacteria bacterium MarineAlpha5_Bin8]PPR54754.1 MAG: tRNA modification GTPase MnmE [Alphaproteobacteria bacterium MarineAlpha5_Bin6]|tara:strand:- start:15 stop:1319 length:1305 start_codon:yes stop_codon:yes gene_type:complete